jgi:hypothetical protein
VNDEEIIAKIRKYHGEELPPPAPASAVAELEAAVGHPMPPLLKRIYLEVADGRFDDRRSVLPLTSRTGRRSGEGTVLGAYRSWMAGRYYDPDRSIHLDGGSDPFGVDPDHPPFVVPLRYWGCLTYSFVDWRTPEGRTWGCDSGILFYEKFTVAQRLTRWLAGHEDYPEPAPRRGRLVHIDGGFHPNRLPAGIHAAHDQKKWTFRSARSHAPIPGAWQATIFGPQPGSHTDGDSQVILSPEPDSHLWWMDLDIPPVCSRR